MNSIHRVSRRNRPMFSATSTTEVVSCCDCSSPINLWARCSSHRNSFFFSCGGGGWSTSSWEVVMAAGVDNTSRRKWDKEEFAKRALEREEEEEELEGRHKGKPRGPLVQRKPLKNRDYEVDLTSRLGKTQVVTPVAPLSQQAGYFCSVCECVVKDSANYLDHINGKKHQRALGMSMRVERASLQQVQDRFETLKRKKTAGGFTEQDFDTRIQRQSEEEEERKRNRREKKKEKKREKEGGGVGKEEGGAGGGDLMMDADMAAMMGFGGFTSSKKQTS